MIGVLVFPDFQLLDASGPISVFEIASRFAGTPASIPDPAAGREEYLEWQSAA